MRRRGRGPIRLRSPRGLIARGGGGFTLVELLIGVFLGVFAIMGLWAIFAVVFKFQFEQYRRDVIEDGTVVSMKSVTRDLMQATSMTSPAWPCVNGDCAGSVQQGANNVLGCTNWDSGGAARMDGNLSMRSFLYCVNPLGPPPAPANSMYYKWIESCAAPGPGCNIACAPAWGACDEAALAPPPGGTSGAMRVAGSVNLDLNSACPNYFCRPAGLNNVLELHYVVGVGTMSMIVNTAATMQKTYNSPFQ